MRMNDDLGQAICQCGEERYDVQAARFEKNARVRYDYRTDGGTLFATVAPTLKEARARCNTWLGKNELVCPREPEAVVAIDWPEHPVEPEVERQQGAIDQERKRRRLAHGMCW